MKNRKSYVHVFVKIERSSPESIKNQIINQIRTLIDQGTIKVGSYLPPTRIFADNVGVSRYSVCLAYEELQVLGYLRSRQGSYNIVQKRRKRVEYNPERRSVLSWEKASNEPAVRLFENFLSNLADIPTRSTSESNAVINLSELQVDPDLFPIDDFRRCVNHVLLYNGSEALDFCPPEGNRALLEYIAQRLRLHGISTSPDEILITGGSQQALDLVIRLLARPEKKVVVEAPTYFNIIPLLQFNQVKILGVPMKQDGMDLDYLEEVLNKETVSFVYTIPNFHNPTGITTSHHHREKLLNICLQHSVPIIEDGFEEEMKYFGIVPLPIKSIDEKNIVIYLGTFSKILFPGVRIGWITADKECIRRLTAVKRSSDLRCGNLVQAAVHYFCTEGYYDLHVKRMHRVFRKRMEVALKTMEECFPDNVDWIRPSGGYTLWVKIPKKLSAAQLHEFMLKHGVVVSPGGYYFPQQNASEYFRVSIARISEEKTREGITRVGKALYHLS